MDAYALVLGHRKTSYATAEDSDSERAKNQSGSEAAERQRSGYAVHMTGANSPGTHFWVKKDLLRTRHSSNTLATFRSWGSFPR